MKRLAPLLAVLLLASCTSSPAASGTKTPASNVKVDTAALRAQKKAAGIEDCSASTASPATHGLPDLTLACLGGGPGVRLSGLRGPAVVNLFAQWCGPCRSEMPYYQQLHEKAGDKVRVLGVDYLDTQPGLALELAQQTGVTYPLLADPSGALRAPLHVPGLPGMVFVDAQGQLVGAPHYGVVRSYAELRGLVQDRLHVRLPS